MDSGSELRNLCHTPATPHSWSPYRSCYMMSQAQSPERVDSGSELEMTAEETAIAAIPPPSEPDRAQTPGLIFPRGSRGTFTHHQPCPDLHTRVLASSFPVDHEVLFRTPPASVKTAARDCLNDRTGTRTLIKCLKLYWAIFLLAYRIALPEHSMRKCNWTLPHSQYTCMHGRALFISFLGIPGSMFGF